MRNNVTIKTPYIPLSGLLKFCGAAMTGGEAGQMIKEGAVLVNGEVCTMRGKKIRPGDVVTFRGQDYTVAYAD